MSGRDPQPMARRTVRPSRRPDRLSPSGDAPQVVVLALANDAHCFREVCAGVGEVAVQLGWHLQFRPDLASRGQAYAPAWRPQAVLAWTTNAASHRALAGWGLPFLDLAQEGSPALDAAGAGRAACDHLIAAGYAHLGTLGNADGPDGRALAFHATARAAGREAHGFTLSWPDLALPPAQLDRRLGAWLAHLPLPLGLWCVSDAFALAAAHVLARLGLAVPDEVGLLGTDADPLLTRLAPCHLASVALPHRELGRRAARALAAQLAGRAPPAPSVVVGAEVLPGASTERQVSPDPVVAAILARLDQSLVAPPRVDRLVEQLGLNRRALERRFRALRGRGIAAELRRRRVLHGRHLLRDGASVGAAAAAVGLSANAFIAAFRAEFGTTPGRALRPG